MADQTLDQLTELTSASDDDILFIVDDPASAKAPRKITKANLFSGYMTKTISTVTKTSADSPYSVLSTDDTILVDTTNAAVTIILPATGRFRVKWIAGTNTLTINVVNSGTIDGTSSYIVQTLYDCIEFVSTATGNYYII